MANDFQAQMAAFSNMFKAMDEQQDLEKKGLQSAATGSSVANIMTPMLGKPSPTYAEIASGVTPVDRTKNIQDAWTKPGMYQAEIAKRGQKQLLDQFDRIRKAQDQSMLLNMKQKEAEQRQQNWLTEMEFKNAELDRKKVYDDAMLNLKLKESQAKASKGANKPLTSAAVLKINEGNAIPITLDTIEKTINEKADMFDPIKGRLRSLNPYDTEAQVLDSEMRAASQQFGRFMEGGVLRKEDEEKYRKMFPNMSDTADTAQGKLRVVREMLKRKQESDLSALKTQGFDIKGLEMPVSAVATTEQQPTKQENSMLDSAIKFMTPKSAYATEPPKIGDIVDGYKYIGGEAGKPESWEQL